MTCFARRERPRACRRNQTLAGGVHGQGGATAAGFELGSHERHAGTSWSSVWRVRVYSRIKVRGVSSGTTRKGEGVNQGEYAWSIDGE